MRLCRECCLTEICTEVVRSNSMLKLHCFRLLDPCCAYTMVLLYLAINCPSIEKLSCSSCRTTSRVRSVIKLPSLILASESKSRRDILFHAGICPTHPRVTCGRGAVLSRVSVEQGVSVDDLPIDAKAILLAEARCSRCTRRILRAPRPRVELRRRGLQRLNCTTLMVSSIRVV